MVKAAEDLKRQQLEKDKERSRILSERIVALPDVDNINDKGGLPVKKINITVLQLSLRLFSTTCKDACSS